MHACFLLLLCAVICCCCRYNLTPSLLLLLLLLVIIVVVILLFLRRPRYDLAVLVLDSEEKRRKSAEYTPHHGDGTRGSGRCCIYTSTSCFVLFLLVLFLLRVCVLFISSLSAYSSEFSRSYPIYFCVF